ncbi:MAG: hypothetical protein IKD59_05400 [Lachnospiraceae bacterium]|nr:hypothetical protein [Lachnospiraceae bacterium]
MDISKILKVIQAAVEENLETIILMLIVVSSLYVINILFGTILGTITEKFIPKKFFFGIFKGFVANVGIFAFCYTLNLFSLTLQQTKDIQISSEFITTIEVFTILIVWGIDLAKDILEKIKSMKQLKYIGYEDVQINVNPDPSVYEEGIG